MYTPLAAQGSVKIDEHGSFGTFCSLSYSHSSQNMGNNKGYALVTGASKGIGKAIAMELAQQGWSLMLTARSADLLEGLKTQIVATCKVQVETYAIDLSLPDAPQQLLDYCKQNKLQIHVLINNAAVLLVSPLLDTDPEAIRRVIDVNLVGPMVLARHLATQMVGRGHGVIINISSQLGFCGATCQ